ncbi:ester hydrolase C11orf54 homolog [Tachyglossus aculeatus]|uniref:ester hydrolase C11orf54 homolog n=1 Tax=Tachyglossus aculeatus TaxID=9261 RepID=UPI0018F5565D|nr:ester hydrolase C11orf54 homolog [Tachyglossus aculeatus]XP_038618036.1 ester hydrolase C11orf54 homolog [Tachyglossus aculeatus]
MANVEKFAFHVPSLEELVGVLQNGLQENFAEVQVSVVDCPDLTKEPFTFPAKGICGKPRIADVGGVPYLIPLVNREKIYNLNVVAKEMELPGAFILGAGAAPFRTLGVNAEFIPIVQAESEQMRAVNGSYIAQINPADGECLLEKYSAKYEDCDFGLLANLYASQGQPGKVIEVKARGRTGKRNFVTCMRETLEKHYGDKPVGMGGTFVIQKGKAKVHVMPPEFSSCPLNSDEDVNNWLKFFEVKAPLICQPVFVSRDPGFDLRVEHTHCFSHHGEGGHYHYDTTPDTAQYLGYFLPAEFLYRIDRPKETHLVGRD